MNLSIIIPVYNSEKYLVNCLESVFRQDLPYSDFEVIVVNDGSEDESKNVILSFKNQFANLLLIDQTNCGVSAARNAGLAIAKGDYITFIDADDYIGSGTLGKIVNYLQDLSLDILYCNIEVVNENGDNISHFPTTGTHGEIADGFSHPRRTYPAVFYKREMINSLKFKEEISIGEDSLFNAMVQSGAERVSYFAEPYYFYRDTPNSLSSSNDNERKVNEMYLAITEILKFKGYKFEKETYAVKVYFENIITIFLTRIIQWGILPTLNRTHFKNFQDFVEENKLDHLIKTLAKDYPFINKSFTSFYYFHKSGFVKNIILRLYHVIKR